MDHVAIMKKEWGLLDKILSGHKRIESRWYINKVAPWDQIKPHDTVYFKNSGEPITAKATVEKVIQISDLDKPSFQKPLFPENEGVVSVGGIDAETILDLFAGDDGIEMDQVPYFIEQFKDKRFCILIFLKDIKEIEPFNINKSGFGAMSAWITISDIGKIKLSENRKLPKPITNVLSKVYSLISKHNIFWYLSGSTSLVIQGVDVKINNDIDIVTSFDSTKVIDSLLSEYRVKDHGYSESEQYRSQYAVYQIGTIKVEVMGDFQYRLKDGDWSAVRDKNDILTLDFNGLIIPLLPLEKELEEYQNLERIDKVEAIKAVLKL